MSYLPGYIGPSMGYEPVDGPLTAADLDDLRHYDPMGGTNGMHDRFRARELERRGLLEYASGACDGERTYCITEAGRAALATPTEATDA